MGKDFLDNIVKKTTDTSMGNIKELLKIIKEHPIKNRAFRMSQPVDPCHGSRDVSRNRPGSGKEP